MLIVVGILFSVIGIALIVVFVRQVIAMRNGYELDARIVDYEEKRVTRYHNGHSSTYITYAPVYEYTDVGNVRRYTSEVGISVIPTIGEETTVFISKSGEVYEKRGAVGVLIIGIVCTVLGVVVTVAGFQG